MEERERQAGGTADGERRGNVNRSAVQAQVLGQDIKEERSLGVGPLRCTQETNTK